MLNKTLNVLVHRNLTFGLLSAAALVWIAPVQAQIGISTPTVNSGELIRASDWNKVKLDLETIAAAIGTLQNQSWASSGADTYFDAGNVGIGINSPTGVLHIFAETPAANSVLLQLGTTDDLDRVRIDEDGDMTIDGKLVVRDSDIYESGGDLELSGEDSLYLSIDWNNNDADTQNMFFGKNSDGAGGSFVELMRLTEAGRLGVGISAPASSVHLSGAIQVGGDASACVAAKAGAMRYDGGAIERCDGANWDALATTNVSDNMGSHIAEQNLNLDTYRLVGEGGTEGLAVDADGSVGIGTDNPTTTLDVVSDEESSLTVRTTAVNGQNASLTLTGAQDSSTTADIASLRLRNKDGAPFEGARISLRNGDVSDSTAVGDLVFFTNTGTTDNLTEKMRILDSGEVGIGTSAPGALLQVIKSAPAPDEIVFQVGTNEDDRRFVVDEDGDFFSDGDAFINGGDIRSENAGLTLGAEDTLYLAADWNDNDAENRSIIFGKNGIGGGGGFVELMRINESGRVGINVNAPANRLHVAENVTNDRVVTIENLATTGSPEGLLVLTGQGAGPAPAFSVGTGTEATHTKKFVVTNSGRVGVGNINPLSKFSTVGAAGEWNLTLDNAGAGANNWFVGSSANDWAAGGGKFLISSDNASNTAEFTIDSGTGFVGIGVTDPDVRLSVGGSSKFDGNLNITSGYLRLVSGGSAALPSLQPGNDNDTGIFHPETNNIGFSTFAVERLRIDENGNVGIGETNPQSALEVEGEVDISGISADGTGKVVCIKADGDLGTCTDAPNGSGVCSCS